MKNFQAEAIVPFFGCAQNAGAATSNGVCKNSVGASGQVVLFCSVTKDFAGTATHSKKVLDLAATASQ